MDPGLEKLKTNLESAVEGMSSEQLSWHPPGKWSAAEVLEHLYLSYIGTIGGFERSTSADWIAFSFDSGMRSIDFSWIPARTTLTSDVRLPL